MCGRYALAGDWADFVSHFNLSALRDESGQVIGADRMRLQPRYNIAPSAQGGFEVPVLRSSGLQSARFWYIPHWWSQPLNRLPTAFNAKSEELSDKPFFRGAEKVLVPLSGWREFPGPAGKKRAFAFERGASAAGKGRFFALAGIGSPFVDPVTQEPGFSFSILTTQASNWLSPYHHRMPLLVPRADYDAWRDPKVLLPELLPSAQAESQRAHEVGQVDQLSVYECSTLGNHTKTQGPECIWSLERVLKDPQLSTHLQERSKAPRKKKARAPASEKQQSLFGDD